MKKIMIMLVMLFSVLTTNAQVRVVSERHLLRATTEWVKLADNGTISTYLRFVAEDHPGMDGADMCTYVDYKYINKKPSGIYTPANAKVLSLPYIICSMASMEHLREKAGI